jgi:glucose/arabinose dehydrogenase
LFVRINPPKRSTLLCAIAASLFVASAVLAIASAGGSRPVIKKVKPKTVAPGEKMVLTGSGFVTGNRHNVVVFLGGRGSADDFAVKATKAPKPGKLRFAAPPSALGSGHGAASGKLLVKNRHGRSRPSATAVVYDDDGDGIPNEQEGSTASPPSSGGSGSAPPSGGAPEEPPSDTTPPDTAIDSAPHGSTTDATPTFEFHSTEAGSTFECSIDVGSPAFAPCSGPGATHTPATPLADGSYVFRVRAVDVDGNKDASPAEEVFSIAESRSCASRGPALAGTGLTSTFEGLENLTSEARAKIGHGAYGGSGFLELCLLRKKLGDPDSTYQLVRASSSAAAGILLDGQRPEKGTDYVYRTDVVTGVGHIPGSNTLVARGAGSVAGVEGWAQVEENCSHCGSSSVQAGSLRSTVKSEDETGPGQYVGEVAVYKQKIGLGWHPTEPVDKRGTDVTARVLVPVSTSTPGTHISTQLNLSVEHPATMRDEGEGTAVDLRDSSQPWISVEARRKADGTIVVVARDSAAPAGVDHVIAETGDITAEGLQNVYLTVQLTSPTTYTVRFKPNTEEEATTLDLDPGAGTDRALPGSMSGGDVWLSLANEMSRSEIATHDVRFDDIDVSYSDEYETELHETFGGAGDNIQLPAGFAADVIAGELLSPTALDFAPNGDMYIAFRDGKLGRLPHDAAMSHGNGSVEEILDIEDLVNSGPNDHGITAIVLDPAFETNGYLYLYYTVQKADTFEDRTVSRVERFHVGEDGTVDRNDPANKVLVGAAAPAPDTGDPATNNTCPPGPTSDCLPSDHYTHSSGGLAFGSDGKLWISTPDGATPEGLDEGGSDHLSMRAVNPDSLAGKVLRVDPATGEGVPGNPEYASQANKKSPRARTWAMGFRNPFRLAQRPTSPNSWYLGDVGWGAWEEVDRLPGAASPGVVPNYGWPCYEGPDESIYKTLFPAECSFANPVAPLYAYDSSGVDHAIIGAAFYTGTAYPEPWKPASGQAAFYYGDYPTGDITMVKTDATDQIVSPGGVQAFARGFREPVMITEGPLDRTNGTGEQTLYLVDLGPRDQAEGKIWRIAYEGP